MANSVVAELSAVVDVETKSGDTPQAFANRLARAANNVKDDEWQGLSEPTQAWVNAALGAIENKTELPLPAGIEDLDLSGEQVELEDAIKASKQKDEKVKKSKGVKAEKVVKPEKPKKEAVAKPKSNGKRGPKGEFPETAKIVLKVKENPHRVKSKDYDKFAKLKSGMTLAAIAEAGVNRSYLRYAAERKLIEINA